MIDQKNGIKKELNKNEGFGKLMEHRLDLSRSDRRRDKIKKVIIKQWNLELIKIEEKYR